MPRYYHHHHYGYYRRGNPICSAIACTVFIIFFLVIMWNTGGYYYFGYLTPYIGLIILIAVPGIIVGIVTSVRRRNQMVAQPVGSISPPQGYPPQGYPPQGYPRPAPTGAPTMQPGGYNPATFQSVPQPKPVGIPQPSSQAPASSSRFCTYCGTPVESGDQRFCANCGAAL